MSEHQRNVWGVILAGGEGKRLQSFIREEYGTDTPKQYCTFTGTRSMLRHTIDRAEMLIPSERLYTIISKQHERHAEEQLADRPSGRIIVQAHNRETGPAILYPLLHVHAQDPEAIVCLFPSDHFILNEQNFMKHVELCTEVVAKKNKSIVLLGVAPHQPESEYGWIIPGKQTIDHNGKPVYAVSHFVEKPDALTAHQLYQKGSLWNTMIIVSKVKTLLSSFKMHTPSVYEAFWGIRNVLGSAIEAPKVEELYAKLPPVNFSYSILGKKPDGLQTVKIEGGHWSDWGDASRIKSDIRRYCGERNQIFASSREQEMIGEAEFAL